MPNKIQAPEYIVRDFYYIHMKALSSLNAVVRHVEDEVALDYVRFLSICVVDDDPRILYVMDDIVTHKVSPTPVFQFDAISLRDFRPVEVMQVVTLDAPVKELGLGFSAGCRIGPQVECFAMSARVMDVVSAKDHSFVEIPRVVAGYGRASYVMDVQCLQSHEFGHSVILLVHSNGRRTARDLQALDREVLRAREVESVLAGIRPAEYYAGLIGRPYDDRTFFCPDMTELEHPPVRVGSRF